MSVLNATEREPGVKGRKLLREGIVPMALVDKGETSLIQAPASDLTYALNHVHGAGIFDLKVGAGKARQVMLKHVERDNLRRQIVHVTLQAVSDSDKVKTEIAVVGVGSSSVVEDGSGVLVHPTDKISVRGKVSALPEHVEVDLSALEMNSSVHASDLVLPDGVELLSSPDAIIFSLQPARDLMADIEAEQAAEAEAAAAAEASTEPEESTE